MELTEQIERVGEHLRAAAALGDERTQQIAEALSGAVAAAVRLALIEAASALAAEVTASLFDVPATAGSTVAVHLEGEGVRVVVTPPADAAATAVGDESENTARISLRLPEGLKAEVERSASREGLSVNAWLVRAISAAARGASERRANNWGPPGSRGGHRITGWVTG